MSFLFRPGGRLIFSLSRAIFRFYLSEMLSLSARDSINKLSELLLLYYCRLYVFVYGTVLLLYCTVYNSGLCAMRLCDKPGNEHAKTFTQNCATD